LTQTQTKAFGNMCCVWLITLERTNRSGSQNWQKNLRSLG